MINLVEGLNLKQVRGRIFDLFSNLLGGMGLGGGRQTKRKVKGKDRVKYLDIDLYDFYMYTVSFNYTKMFFVLITW